MGRLFCVYKYVIFIKLLILLISSSSLLKGLVSIQDFLCGCDYCDSVSLSQPLQLPLHYQKCEESRNKKKQEYKNKINNQNSVYNDNSVSQAIDNNKTISESSNKGIQEKQSNNKNNKTQDYQIENYYDFSINHPFIGWVWIESLGWIYCDPQHEPYYYSEKRGWFLYKKHTNPIVLYEFNSQSWKKIFNEK